MLAVAWRDDLPVVQVLPWPSGFHILDGPSPRRSTPCQLKPYRFGRRGGRAPVPPAACFAVALAATRSTLLDATLL